MCQYPGQVVDEPLTGFRQSGHGHDSQATESGHRSGQRTWTRSTKQSRPSWAIGATTALVASVTTFSSTAENGRSLTSEGIDGGPMVNGVSTRGWWAAVAVESFGRTIFWPCFVPNSRKRWRHTSMVLVVRLYPVTVSTKWR